ncbi:spore coat protein [Effusibacillus dendaii]|uniref:Spore coat protein n=1 Tax=Effusibacillus dendaii TaxID=2743772 RepID=A0A7I8DEM3_9BACL|nr:spore coat protein [Effusibacillus dendaii]BCJ88487.1 hypothetical protein skT53_34720 [Effusibacillus dendaii]
MNQHDAHMAGELLGFAKTGVRNLAAAITETATPRVREVLNRQLHDSIRSHAHIFNYMYERGLYPAYSLEQIIQGDLRRANMALQMAVDERY